MIAAARTEPHPRLVFANQLRGLAALSVASSHLIGVFWAMREFVSVATFSPPQPGANPALFDLINHAWFELGPFGVAIFFLISGLVVPFSLERHTRVSFLLARVLRIYPTYIVIFLLEMVLLYTASRYWHRPFVYNFRDIISNCLLINNLVDHPSLDFVNWTLAIEIKFYLILSLLSDSIKNCRVRALFMLAGFFLALNILHASGFPGAGWSTSVRLIDALSLESLYLMFMLIGVLFNFHIRGCINAQKLFLGVLAMTLLFIGCWNISTIKMQYPVVTINYIYGVILFSFLFLFRNNIKNSRYLDFFASISFPFYLIHSLFGYSIMKILMIRYGLGYYISIIISLVFLLLISFAFHVTLEAKTIVMGRRLMPRKCVNEV